MSRRIEQVNALIQKELGSILLREFEAPLGTLLTITNVETSADRDHATVSVSIYPNTKAVDLFETLMSKQGFLQHLLNQTLVMEHAPTIHFRLDTIEQHAEEIEKLIDQIEETRN